MSSLGLPKDGEDYHAKVLMSEYIPIGHYAVQDSRPAGGWRYYSARNGLFRGSRSTTPFITQRRRIARGPRTH